MAKLTAKTELARQYYVHGINGRPITDPQRICSLSGIAEATFYKHRATWDREREALMAASGPPGLSLRVKPEDLAKNEADTALLRSQMDELALELKTNDRAEDLFERICDNFDPDLYDLSELVSVFKAYLATRERKKSVRSQFLEVQKRWLESCGIASAVKVAETRENELAKGGAKLELREMLAEAERAETMRPAKPTTNVSVFRTSRPAS